MFCRALFVTWHKNNVLCQKFHLVFRFHLCYYLISVIITLSSHSVFPSIYSVVPSIHSMLHYSISHFLVRSFFCILRWPTNYWLTGTLISILSGSGLVIKVVIHDRLLSKALMTDLKNHLAEGYMTYGWTDGRDCAPRFYRSIFIMKTREYYIIIL